MSIAFSETSNLRERKSHSQAGFPRSQPLSTFSGQVQQLGNEGTSEMKSKITTKEPLSKGKRSKRTLLPEFKALVAKAPVSNSLDDLNAVRGDR